MQNLSMMQPFDILHRLKEGTKDIHQRVEQRLPIFDPGFTLAQYVQLLERFYGFWAPLESKLSKVKALSDPALGLQYRMKSHLLEGDLLILGRDSRKVSPCADLPSVDAFLPALGCLYVLEGSTMGGVVISKHVERHLNLRAGSGASFFNASGEAVGRRWSEFKSFLAAHTCQEDCDDVVGSAQQTFLSLFKWLPALPRQ
jgi:heme oxygenase